MSKKETKSKRGYPLPNPNLPRNFGKLLVFNVLGDNELAFALGKMGIYLVSTVPIKTMSQKAEGAKAKQMIANIRYDDNSMVEYFMKTSGIQSKRIFKYAGFTNLVRTRALFYASALNLLNLCEGKIIRIKSKHRDLRDEFYKIALEVKKESKLNVEFDYDAYDVELEINRYKTPKKVYIILTTTGLSEVVKDLEQKQSVET